MIYVQSAIGVSMIAFGGFSWALDGAAAPVAAVLRLEAAMGPKGALRSGNRPADAMPAREIRLRDVTFGYPGGAPVLDRSISPFPPAHRSPSWGRTARARPLSRSCCAACTIRSPAPSKSTA